MARAGHTSCPLCGTAEIAVSRTGAGTMNIKCHRCEFSGYGKQGSRAARMIESKMTPDDDEPASAPSSTPPKDAKKEAPKEVPPPAKKPRNSAFDMSNL